MRRWMLSMVTITCAACSTQTEKQRQREAAMIEQAKLDAGAEEEFTKDSLALASSIAVDTVALLETEPKRGIDENGYSFTYRAYAAISRSGARCLLQMPRYHELVVGDTLSCQWEPKQ